MDEYSSFIALFANYNLLSNCGRFRSFPLLKLPFLALQPIVKQFEIVDLVQISQLSNKVRSLVKFCHNGHDYEISVTIYYKWFRIKKVEKKSGEFMYLTIFPTVMMQKQSSFRHCKEIWDKRGNIGNLEFDYYNLDNVSNIYTDSWMEVGMKITDELLDLLSASCQQITITPSIEYLDVYNWLNSLGGKFNECLVYRRYSQDDFMVFLENFRFSKSLWIGVLRMYDFYIEKLQIVTDDLEIESPSWVTFQNVLDMRNCVTIILDGGTLLTDKKWNLFLKMFISGFGGRSSRLEYLKFRFYRDYNLATVIEGIKMEKVDSERVYRRRDIEKSDKGGFHFKLDSGEMATVYLKGPDVTVVVWKD